MMLPTTEPTVVYVVPASWSRAKRRFLTARGAVRHMAARRVWKKYPCECEPRDDSTGYPGCDCGLHEGNAKLIDRYERLLWRAWKRARAADREETTKP